MNNCDNVYHCCVQKTASQWIKAILSDPLIHKLSVMDVYSPNINYIAVIMRDQLSKTLPTKKIVTPFYVRYDEFRLMPKPKSWKAFFVMRDPRDIALSWYFSTKYSHRLINDYIRRERGKLAKMSEEEGILYSVEKVAKEHYELYFSMKSWNTEGKKDENILICRYEDLIGQDQIDVFKNILRHCKIEINDNELKDLLKKYSFERITGRKQGDEDVKHHLRKGIAGDWINYYSDKNKSVFKEAAGQLLIDLGYEKDFDW